MFLSHQQMIGTTPTACIRFAVLSRVEIPTCLIRTLLRFAAQPTLGSAGRLHRRQPVTRSQDLLSPLRQFRRRLAVVGSVAHLVATSVVTVAFSPGRTVVAGGLDKSRATVLIRRMFSDHSAGSSTLARGDLGCCSLWRYCNPSTARSLSLSQSGCRIV